MVPKDQTPTEHIVISYPGNMLEMHTKWENPFKGLMYNNISNNICKFSFVNVQLINYCSQFITLAIVL